MDREAYFLFHKEFTEKMYAITEAKNRDYAGPQNSDPFANFSRVAALDICSTEQGFLTRMLDKMCRINSFVQAGVLHVKDESVNDTLMDLANYAILFAGYLKSKRDDLEDAALVEMAKQAEKEPSQDFFRNCPLCITGVAGHIHYSAGSKITL